jgi:molecular chaperone DnaK (HSP70)
LNKILASVYEPLGGRDFNEALLQHFLKQVKEKSGESADVSEENSIVNNPKVLSKLRIQLGKVKETLSASKDASFTIQNLLGDFDFSGIFLIIYE